ncbi:hypothetical protein ONZ45_g19685 [Pleurotus djamor]|nr:hypothetical protein ONZ45_g19685 [Pleurotus djamor]
MIALYSSAHIDVAGAQAAFLHARTLYGAILATMANVVVWDWNIGNGAISALLYAYAGGNGSRMEYRFDIDSANYEVVHINGMDVRNVLDVGGLRFKLWERANPSRETSSVLDHTQQVSDIPEEATSIAQTTTQ